MKKYNIIKIDKSIKGKIVDINKKIEPRLILQN